MHNHLKTVLGVNCFVLEDQCAVPPGTCKTQQGKPFVVFTPFKNCWLRTLEETDKKLLDMVPLPLPNKEIEKQDNLESHFIAVLKQLLSQTSQTIIDRVDIDCCIFENAHYMTVEKDVNAAADDFVATRAVDYKKTRDFPNIQGTSGLSPYLALGMISARSLLCRIRTKNNGHLSNGNEGLVTWVNELCWRDFYRSIFVAFPHVMRNQPFKTESMQIRWSLDTVRFTAWCNGMTGYPIVDAGMRQLNATGWMHNRLRMVTAMFLVKDLMVNTNFNLFFSR